MTKILVFSGGKKYNIKMNEIRTSPLNIYIFSTHLRKAWSVTSECCTEDRKGRDSLTGLKYVYTKHYLIDVFYYLVILKALPWGVGTHFSVIFA